MLCPPMLHRYEYVPGTPKMAEYVPPGAMFPDEVNVPLLLVTVCAMPSRLVQVMVALVAIRIVSGLGEKAIMPLDCAPTTMSIEFERPPTVGGPPGFMGLSLLPHPAVRVTARRP